MTKTYEQKLGHVCQLVLATITNPEALKRAQERVKEIRAHARTVDEGMLDWWLWYLPEQRPSPSGRTEILGSIEGMQDR